MMQAERSRRTCFAYSDENAEEICASSSSSSSSPRGGNFIEHRVSKMDTLAGVAIKYGVEVADVRRMNGLVTDLQMFAHKSLHIPLPGRHPPSPILSSGSAVNGEHTPPCRPLNGVLDSFQSLQLKPPQHRVSSAMSTLQGYYGLTPPKKVPEGTEMTVYPSRGAHYLEDQLLPGESLASNPLLGRHRKSRSLANVNGLFPGNGEISEASENGEVDRSIRRRQKADACLSVRTPELLLREESSGGGFSGRTAKSLALRMKSGSRPDQDTTRLIGGETSLSEGMAAVRKSMSTSNLQESENGSSSSSSMWPSSRWNLMSDAIARPIFDGLPKPIGIRRNKAALD